MVFLYNLRVIHIFFVLVCSQNVTKVNVLLLIVVFTVDIAKFFKYGEEKRIEALPQSHIISMKIKCGTGIEETEIDIQNFNYLICVLEMVKGGKGWSRVTAHVNLPVVSPFCLLMIERQRRVLKLNFR